MSSPNRRSSFGSIPKGTAASPNSGQTNFSLHGVIDTFGSDLPKTKNSVPPLEPPDCHYLNAAEGWLNLGDAQSALEELESIASEFQVHPDVLTVRCDLFTVTGKWPEVFSAASKLVAFAPDRPSGWIRRSYALHEMKLTQQAFNYLLPAAKLFQDVATIPYNLACYCAQLGGLEEARYWLERAYKIGDAEALKLAARCDPDLAPLFASAAEL